MNTATTPKLKHHSSTEMLIYKILNIITLISSIGILVLLSVEILKGPEAIPHHIYLDIQLAICIILFVDFWYSFYLAPKRWKFFYTYFVLLLVSVPYYNIVDWFHISTTTTEGILLRAIIFVRGGYGLVIMINWFTKNKVANMMITYLIMLVAMAYFGSLIFYSIEKDVNPMLKNFEDAAWWACMDVTTVGCAIEPVTLSGRILAVILAVMGMSMFPILTVYITNYFQNQVTPQAGVAATTGNNGASGTGS